MSLIREAWHNPLARAADRAEATARVLLTVVWLCAIPVMIIVASSVWHGVSVAAESAQQSRIATTAQLLEDAPAMTADDQGVVAYQLVQVAARWVAPDGSERTGTVPAAGGRSGERIEVWVDRSGEITPAPVPLSTSAVLIITVTVGAVLAWGALLMAAQFLIRGRLDRRRIVGWDIEWQRIEPLWSGRSRDEGAQP
jgi:hypothetical protein